MILSYAALCIVHNYAFLYLSVVQISNFCHLLGEYCSYNIIRVNSAIMLNLIRRQYIVYLFQMHLCLNRTEPHPHLVMETSAV